MNTKITILTILIFCAFTSSGQNTFRSTGTTELGGEFGFSSQSTSGNNGSSSTTFSSSLFIGIMASTGFEIGFRPGFTLNSFSGDSYNIYNLYLNPIYNFNTTSNVYPYLGFIVGYNSISYSSDNIGGLGIGGEGGLKIHLRGNSMLLIKVEYLSQNYSGGDNNGFSQSSNDVTLKTTSIGLGYRIFLTRAVAVKK